MRSRTTWPDTRELRGEVERVDRELERLAGELAGRARLIVSADHGLITVPDEAKHRVAADDELLELLDAPPSGEPRVPFFHCRPGAAEAFAERFRARFGGRFALLTAAEVEDLRLLGPGPLHAATRSRLGDYIALADGPDVLVYGAPRAAEMRGYHAGLSPDEVRIPLVVA